MHGGFAFLRMFPVESCTILSLSSMAMASDRFGMLIWTAIPSLRDFCVGVRGASAEANVKWVIRDFALSECFL